MLAQFRERLPPLQPVAPIAEDLVRQESVLDIYEDPKVRAVRLRDDAAPVVAVSGELWINLAVESGRQIIDELNRRNEGTVGLWVACLLHAPQSVQEVAGVVRAPATKVKSDEVV